MHGMPPYVGMARIQNATMEVLAVANIFVVNSTRLKTLSSLALPQTPT